MRSYSIPFVLVALSGSVPVDAQMPLQSADKTSGISVVGVGEVKTAPDLAIISYTLRGEGRSSDDALGAMVAMGARIDSAIAAVDPNAEPQTDKVEVTPVKGPECKERDYGAKQLSTGICATVGYVAEQAISFRTSSTKDAGTLVGLVGRGGADDAELRRFAMRDPSTAERAAIAAAVADAQTKATAVAAGSHLSLGPISSVSIGARNVGMDIIVTGSRIPQPNAPAAPPPVTVSLNPEPLTTSATVTVTYAIAR